MTPEELWDRHGHALLALARTLVLDESTARVAVSSGLAALYQDEPDVTHTLRTAARYVFAQGEAMLSHRALVAFEPARASAPSAWRRMALNQRRMLALCIHGGFSYRDAAAALGIAPETAARLLTTALRQPR